MIVELQRNGRVIPNIVTGKPERVLDTYINGKRIVRGHCDDYFRRVTGIKIPLNGSVRLRVEVISDEI